MRTMAKLPYKRVVLRVWYRYCTLEGWGRPFGESWVVQELFSEIFPLWVDSEIEWYLSQATGT